MSGETQASARSRIERTVRAEVRKVEAYHVPPPSDVIKLDAMENPYEWPGPLREAWVERLRAVQVNRYPDADPTALKQALRDAMEIPPGCELLLGNGSDELIQLLLLAIADDARVLAPDPSFSMYRLSTEVLGREFVAVPLAMPDFELDTAAMLAAIERTEPALVFIAYPNNPTGNLFPREAIEAVIEAAPGMVVVDEAYAPFARETFMSALTRHEHLLVMRTVSKLGLAGVRLGFLAGRPEWIEALGKLRLPYNIGGLAQAAATLALEHYPLFVEQTDRILAERAGLHGAISRMNHLTVWRSDANFLLVRAREGEGRRTVAALREAGILVRDLHGSGAHLEDCFRVTVGRPDENTALVAALRECG